MDYTLILNQIKQELNAIEDKGKVVDYILELKKIDPNSFGFYLYTLEDKGYGLEDYQVKFSIQSIVKVFLITIAFKLDGEAILKRVGVEPSGNPFNSLTQLEYENGIPRNPFINAGSLVVCDFLIDKLSSPYDDFIDFVRSISSNNLIDYNQTIFESEKNNQYRNAALINLMKSFKNIHNDIQSVLNFYFKVCSIEMDCQMLSKAFIIFANEGKTFPDQKKIISKSQAKRINAIMQTCGFYDEAGEFSYKVGLPGKSGVGGGIVSVCPNRYSVTVWSPKLNKKGNSYKGMKALELLTSKTSLSVF